jgi:hypothetical protein
VKPKVSSRFQFQPHQAWMIASISLPLWFDFNLNASTFSSLCETVRLHKNVMELEVFERSTEMQRKGCMSE